MSREVGPNDPARHARVTELFLKACDLQGARRAAFLDRECAGDGALRREVEVLLAQDGSAEERGFLAEPAATIPVAEAAQRRLSSRLGTAETLEFVAELPGATTRRRVAWVVLLVCLLAAAALVPWPRSGGPDPAALAARHREADHLVERHEFEAATSALRGLLRDEIVLLGPRDAATLATARQLADMLEARNHLEDADELRRVVAALSSDR